MLVSGKNGCLLWCRSGFNIFGNMWDRGYVKMVDDTYKVKCAFGEVQVRDG